ncbi:MAG: biopolymer transporter ExbD, partial [Pseudomonadota bacterium]
MAEINVTPFVDVMLVLLIIFMVAAPLLTAGVPLNLPKGQANPLPVDKQKKPLIVEIDAEGRIFVDKSEYPLDQLIAGVVEAVESRVASGDSEAQDPTDELLLLRADGDNTHARVS